MPVSDGVIKPIPNASLPEWYGPHGSSRLTTVRCAVIGPVSFHRRVAEAMQQVWESIAAAGLGALVDMEDWRESGGTFCDRRIRGTTDQWSPHSWGVAVDLNTNHVGTMATGAEWIASSGSNFRCSPSLIAPSLAKLAPYFHAWGFTWGGEWASYKDPMHYEATDLTCALLEGKPLTSAAQAVIDQARAAIGGAGGLGVVRLEDGAGTLIRCRPQIVDGVTWVDLRAMAEALGAAVTWDGAGVHVYFSGHEIETATWTVQEGDSLRVPLRQVIMPLGWRVAVRNGKEPDHTHDTPPRIYLERKPG